MDPISRYTKAHPCPICGGSERDRRHAGLRCAGFLGGDGQVAFCTRDEFAGTLPLNEKTEPPSYAHRLNGRCRCGTEHTAPAPSPPGPHSRQRPPDPCTIYGEPEAVYPYRNADGIVLCEILRFPGKVFRPRQPDGHGGWIGDLQGVRRVRYRLPELLAAAPDDLIVVTEGERDADRVVSLGIVGTTAAGGAGKWADEFSELLRGHPVAITEDNDAAGRLSSARIARSATAHGASRVTIVRFADLPELRDVSDWLDAGHAAGDLLELIAGTPPCDGADAAVAAADLESASGDTGPELRHDPDALVYISGGFELASSRQRTRWRVAIYRDDTLLGVSVLNPADRKERAALLRSLSDVEDAQRDLLGRLVMEISLRVDSDWMAHREILAQRDAAQGRVKAEDAQRGAAARQAALRRELEAEIMPLLQDPALLHNIGDAIGDQGVVGEAENRLLVYLAVHSQHLLRPISLMVKGESSGGKSWLVEKGLDLFPNTSYLDFTSMSERALIYDDRSYSHRTLVIYEVHGQGNEFCQYLIRTLMSEGHITHQTVEKTSEGMMGRTVVKEGPTNFVTTTTAPEVHAENETRVWSLLVNDSPEVTREVLRLKSRQAAGQWTPPDPQRWQLLQTWMAMFGRGVDVIIPYAPLVAEHMPDHPVRLRRDFDRLLVLIEAIAHLHQCQRPRDEVGRVVASLADYGMARALVHETFSQSVQGLTAKTLELVAALDNVLAEKAKEPLDEKGARASLTDLVRTTGKAKWYVSRWLRPAIELGMVDNTETQRGKAAALKRGAYDPAAMDALPTVELLAAELEESVTWIDPISGELRRATPAPAGVPTGAAESTAPGAGGDPDEVEEWRA